MNSILKNTKTTYSNSPKSLLVGDIPVKETTANLTENHIIIYAGSFNYTTEYIFEKYVEDSNLSLLCMAVSEKSLVKDWENEDDDRWNSFLK